MVQRIRHPAFTAGGRGLIPAQGTKIPHASHYSQKKKEGKVLMPSLPFSTPCLIKKEIKAKDLG